LISVVKICFVLFFSAVYFAAVQSAAGTGVVVCSKKPSDAETSHVLDFMLEEPGTAGEDDLSAGPKRCKLFCSSFQLNYINCSAFIIMYHSVYACKYSDTGRFIL